MRRLCVVHLWLVTSPLEEWANSLQVIWHTCAASVRSGLFFYVYQHDSYVVWGYSNSVSPFISRKTKSTDTSHQEAQLSKEKIRIPCITNSYNEKSIIHFKGLLDHIPSASIQATRRCRAEGCSINPGLLLPLMAIQATVNDPLWEDKELVAWMTMSVSLILFIQVSGQVRRC